MEINDDVNSTTNETREEVVETTENITVNDSIDNSLLTNMTNESVNPATEPEVQTLQNAMIENVNEPSATAETPIEIHEIVEIPAPELTEIAPTMELEVEKEVEKEVEEETPANTNSPMESHIPVVEITASNEIPLEAAVAPEVEIVTEEISPVIVAEVPVSIAAPPLIEIVEAEHDLHVEGESLESKAIATLENEAGTFHYESLSKPELVNAAQDAVKLDNLREASDRLKVLRPIFENAIREEQQKELAEFVEGGGDRDAFVVTPDPSKDQFYAAYDILKKRKEEQRVQIEKQKQDNLKTKQAILEKIKAIVDGEESKDSIEQIKFLQTEWKRIKVIPQEHAQTLWDTYSFYIDKFYDNRSIYYELKELDRQKNLSAKIELCLRVDELKNQNSMKQCMILLNKYHEDWKSIGPVPKEVSEELWQRFKGASDVVHNRYRVYITELEAIQTVNLQKKREILAKAQELAQLPIEKGKDWNQRSRDYEELLAEWKKVGMVPREFNNIWDNFRGIIDEFYKQKNLHFKELNKGRMENFRKKEELCVKAESLKDSTDWGRTSKELVHLQDEWKTIGAVPDKYNESIWKRFRTACDVFFNAKNEKFASQKGEYIKNLELKNEILAKLDELVKSEDYPTVARELRILQDEWNSVGHVEMKVKDALYKRYNTALDTLYATLRKHNSEFEQTQNKQRFENIAQQQDGKFRLQSESRKLQDRIRILQENIDTLQNNIGFFANSKNADSLRKKVEDDIAAHKNNISKLKEQLQLLRGMQAPQQAK